MLIMFSNGSLILVINSLIMVVLMCWLVCWFRKIGKIKLLVLKNSLNNMVLMKSKFCFDKWLFMVFLFLNKYGNSLVCFGEELIKGW